MDTLSDLAFFCCLARHPTLAATALTLNVTPPIVSRRLAALEKRLGVRLIQRTTRRLNLTDEGERFLIEGERILADMSQLEQSIMSSQAIPSGVLRLNASFGFGRRHLGTALAEFARCYPEISIELTLSDRPLDLIEHGLDLGIRFSSPPDSRTLARKLAHNRRLLCAAPSYLAHHPMPRHPKELNDHACIVIRENTQAFNNWQLIDGKQSLSVKVTGPLSVNHGEVAVDWAIAGHGILLRSEWDIAHEIRQGRLVHILPEWSGTEADIYAVYPERHGLSAKVKVFLDFLASRFESYRQEGKTVHW